jgi:DNA-binding CsgD family transcriptional regulator
MSTIVKTLGPQQRLTLFSETLTDKIYEAGIVPGEWQGVLDGLTSLSDAYGTMMFMVRAGELRWLSSTAAERTVAEYVAEGWPRIAGCGLRLFERQEAAWLRHADLYTPEEIEGPNADPVFTEFLRPRGLGHGAGTGIWVPTGDRIAVVVERPWERGTPEPELITQLDSLRPHLARAAFLSARLAIERLGTLTRALETVGLPAGVLGPAGRLLAANELLEKLMPRVLRERHGQIEIAAPAANALFVTALMTLPRQYDARAVRSIPIAARGDDPPMIVHLVPTRGHAHDFFLGARCILIVTPVVPTEVPTAEVIQGLFDLTPAEARVARAMAAREPTEKTAARLGVGAETIYAHSKAILRKTGLRRNIDLAALLVGATVPRRHKKNV